LVWFDKHKQRQTHLFCTELIESSDTVKIKAESFAIVVLGPFTYQRTRRHVAVPVLLMVSIMRITHLSFRFVKYVYISTVTKKYI
jgi:hypothetical protein